MLGGEHNSHSGAEQHIEGGGDNDGGNNDVHTPPSDDDGFEGAKKSGEEKKTGRRKINIEFIEDKSRRHITFSKRKAGIMKKVYLLA